MMEHDTVHEKGLSKSRFYRISFFESYFKSSDAHCVCVHLFLVNFSYLCALYVHMYLHM